MPTYGYAREAIVVRREPVARANPNTHVRPGAGPADGDVACRSAGAGAYRPTLPREIQSRPLARHVPRDEAKGRVPWCQGCIRRRTSRSTPFTVPVAHCPGAGKEVSRNRCPAKSRGCLRVPESAGTSSPRSFTEPARWITWAFSRSVPQDQSISSGPIRWRVGSADPGSAASPLGKHPGHRTCRRFMLTPCSAAPNGWSENCRARCQHRLPQEQVDERDVSRAAVSDFPHHELPQRRSAPCPPSAPKAAGSAIRTRSMNSSPVAHSIKASVTLSTCFGTRQFFD